MVVERCPIRLRTVTKRVRSAIKTGAKEAGFPLLDEIRGSTDILFAVGERHLQSALSEAGLGIALVDADGCYVDMNAAFCDLVGYSTPGVDHCEGGSGCFRRTVFRRPDGLVSFPTGPP